MYFHYFVIISPWKRAGPIIWTILNPLYPRMLCAKFGWNWPSGSGEEDENVKNLQTDGRTDRQTTDERWSEKLTELIRIIKYIIHLRKEWSFSTIQWLWRRFLESCQGIFTVAKISPRKKCCPHLKIKLNPLYPRIL